MKSKAAFHFRFIRTEVILTIPSNYICWGFGAPIYSRLRTGYLQTILYPCPSPAYSFYPPAGLPPCALTVDRRAWAMGVGRGILRAADKAFTEYLLQSISCGSTNYGSERAAAFPSRDMAISHGQQAACPFITSCK
jgi:hypothetical protein